MSITTNVYPDNFRRGIPGSPEHGPRFMAKARFNNEWPSISSNMLAEERANLRKIAAIIRKAGEEIAPLVGSLHYATYETDKRKGMAALDAVIDLPAIADEIEQDDIELAEKAASGL